MCRSQVQVKLEDCVWLRQTVYMRIWFLIDPNGVIDAIVNLITWEFIVNMSSWMWYFVQYPRKRKVMVVKCMMTSSIIYLCKLIALFSLPLVVLSLTLKFFPFCDSKLLHDTLQRDIEVWELVCVCFLGFIYSSYLASYLFFL